MFIGAQLAENWFCMVVVSVMVCCCLDVCVIVSLLVCVVVLGFDCNFCCWVIVKPICK